MIHIFELRVENRLCMDNALYNIMLAFWGNNISCAGAEKHMFKHWRAGTGHKNICFSPGEQGQGRITYV